MVARAEGWVGSVCARGWSRGEARGRSWGKAVGVGVGAVVALAAGSGIAWTQVSLPDPPPALGSLKGIPVPEPAGPAGGIDRFIRDRGAAIALGKAMFWDAQVGSDGQACASCHFHAGADDRVKNQLDPAILGGDGQFTRPMGSGGAGGPNYTLTAADFPFHRLADPLDRNSAVLFDTDDVVSSQGSFGGGFVSVSPVIAEDMCGVPDLAVFQVGGLATRRVEPRNTPTVINAAFNFRNFWDGRANNRFNGVTPFGARDPGAQIYELSHEGVLAPRTIALDNASLASQAVGPPLSDFEMSCLGRSFADLGRKLLHRAPLAEQRVAATDSALGKYRASSGVGLSQTYQQLIENAFQPAYWSATAMVARKGGMFTQEEANFSLFWGLAIQLYESTLISNDAPIDRYFEGDPAALTDPELRGLEVFRGKGRCIACHSGAELTSAATTLQASNQENGLVERMIMGDFGVALYDDGFYNTGVRPSAEDRGVGGSDPFGNPLSYTRQFKQSLLGGLPLDPFAVDPCTFAVDPCAPLAQSDPRDAVDGAFKTPGLRNVELTGPYFHNGGQATLEQVVAFYNRGGDQRGANPANLDPDIEALQLTTDEQADLVAFLKRPLTDDRVRWEMAPFDHPELVVPDGALGSEVRVSDSDRNHRADDRFRVIPAIGAGGRPLVYGPLRPFQP